MLTCFLLVGMVASICGGLRGCFSVDCVVRRFLPDANAWSPRLLLLELFASVRFRLWLLPLPLLFFSSCACLVSSETAASRMLTVALAPDSERTFSFGRSFCSVSGSAPSSLVASWCGSLGACLPFVPCLFLWSRCHSRVNGRGAGEVLPIGLFPLSASALAVADKGGRVLRAHPFFGTIAWCLFKSLLFPSYATRCRYDVPGVLASGSGLAASACSYACGRYLRIALGPGAGFPFISLPGGRVV